MLRADSSERMNPETNVQKPFPSLSGLVSCAVTITVLLTACLRNPRLGHEPEPAFMRAEIKLDLITRKLPCGAKSVCRIASQMRCLGNPIESDFTAGQEFRGMHRILVGILFLHAILTS